MNSSKFWRCSLKSIRPYRCKMRCFNSFTSSWARTTSQTSSAFFILRFPSSNKSIIFYFLTFILYLRHLQNLLAMNCQPEYANFLYFIMFSSSKTCLISFIVSSYDSFFFTSFSRLICWFETKRWMMPMEDFLLTLRVIFRCNLVYFLSS